MGGNLLLIKIKPMALAGVAQFVGCGPADQKVMGSISGQGTRLGCGFSPRLWHVRKATN